MIVHECDACEAERNASRELRDALADAYTWDGIDIWWRSWVKADAEKRNRMELSILLDHE